MRFSRISITKSGVSLGWVTTDNAGGKTTHELESKDKPLPSFAGALQAFSGFALQLIGAPTEWDESVRVTTLNFHEDKAGRRGFQVSFNRPVEKARGAAVSITTPTLWEADNPDAEVVDGFYDAKIVDLIDVAHAEAKRFHAGERQQAELFEKKSVAEADADDLATRRGRGGKKAQTPATVQ